MHDVIETLTWKWYTYGPHPKYEDAWQITNNITKQSVSTSSESACLKIIELAHTLKTGKPKPLNHRTLENKAKDLEGITYRMRRYWTWDGRQLTYDTCKYT